MTAPAAAGRTVPAMTTLSRTAVADFAATFLAALEAADLSWLDEAQCVIDGLEVPDIFPAPGDNAAAVRALASCADCPVAEQCRDWATRTGRIKGIHGVWAGTTGAMRHQR